MLSELQTESMNLKRNGVTLQLLALTSVCSQTAVFSFSFCVFVTLENVH
jgi:hypothetical protein